MTASQRSRFSTHSVDPTDQIRYIIYHSLFDLRKLRDPILNLLARLAESCLDSLKQMASSLLTANESD
ncbi:MAG: hypothetical protein CV090_08680 [Nitrospira sp. WS238]|nr:hypothetical protein [Nitrospira sp. WS238]